MVEEAPLVLNTLNAWQKSAHEGANENDIVIYATKPFCSTILLPVTTSLHEKLPQTRFVIRSADYNESLRRLRKAQCQFAIIHADLVDEAVLRKELHLDDTYVVKKILENDFLVLINKNDPLNNKNEIPQSALADYTFASVSSTEMITKSSFLKTGLAAKQALFFDSPNGIFQAVNNNIHYYGILTSIYADTEMSNLYTHTCFRSVSDFHAQSAFFLIYAKVNYPHNAQIIHHAIEQYCQKYSGC